MTVVGALNSVSAGGWALLSTFVAGLLAWLSTRGKNRGDLTAVLSQTAIDLMNELRAEVVRLNQKIDDTNEAHSREIAVVRAEVVDCERRHDRLEAYLAEIGVDVPSD